MKKTLFLVLVILTIFIAFGCGPSRYEIEQEVLRDISFDPSSYGYIDEDYIEDYIQDSGEYISIDDIEDYLWDYAGDHGYVNIDEIESMGYIHEDDVTNYIIGQGIVSDIASEISRALYNAGYDDAAEYVMELY